MSASPASRRSTGRVEQVGMPSSSKVTETAALDRCAQLSSGQIEVLRLVNRHLSSKEIAARLGISSHTVDQRVRGAIRTLGVSRRSEAARLIDLYERQEGLEDLAPGPAPAAYQQLIHQAPHIDDRSVPGQSEGAVSFQIRHADRTRGAGADCLETEQRAVSVRPPLFFPLSTPQQARNAWSLGQRLAMIVGIAIMSSLSVGMMLAGLESLSRLFYS